MILGLNLNEQALLNSLNGPSTVFVSVTDLRISAKMVASGSSTEVTSVNSGHTGHKETEPRDGESRPTNPVSTEKISEKPAALANVEGHDDILATKEIDGIKPESHEDDTEYPAAWRLGLITIALCLSVFCMALVS